MSRFLMTCVRVDGLHVPELHIDDRTLMSSSPEGLQQQFNTLRDLARILLHACCIMMTSF